MRTHTSQFPRTEAHVVAALSVQSLRSQADRLPRNGQFRKQPTEISLTAPLSPDERSHLVKCEATIRAGLKTFVEVGTALLEIRDGKLYRETHGTLEEYCRGTWGFSARFASMQIEASTVVKQLRASPALLVDNPAKGEPPTIKTIVPETESQARPLTRLPVDMRPPAWREAVDVAQGKPTARHVEAAVRARETAAPVRAGNLRLVTSDEVWKPGEYVSDKLRVVADAIARVRRLGKAVMGDKICRDHYSSAMGSLQAIERRLIEMAARPKGPSAAQRALLSARARARWAKCKANWKNKKAVRTGRS